MKSDDYFFQILPFGPPYGIFIHPLVPQRKHEKLAKVSLWPKCHSGQSVSGQSVTLAKVSPAKVTPAKLSLAKVSFWPNCHSGQTVIQPNSFELLKKLNLYYLNFFTCSVP